MLSITEINSIDEFFELQDNWNRVLEKSKDNNVFLTWEFLSTFWNHFGGGKKLRILVTEDKNEIIAIAPLRQSRYNFGRLFGYNVIEPLGYRGADYTGLILTERLTECFQLLLNYLTEDDDWDFIYLLDLPGTSTIHELLPTESKYTPRIELTSGIVCPFITLPESNDVFMQSLDKNLRKDLERCMRNLEKDYQKVEIKRYEALGSVEEGMDIFFELHQKRWKSKGTKGAFSSQEARDFSVDVANKFADRGWLALYFLTVKDEPIAAQYCHEYGQKMYYCLGGFDIEYSKYSVGNLLTVKIIEDCIKRKLREYDFLKGNESYKLRWTTQYRTNFGIRFVNNKFTSRLYGRGMRLSKSIGIDRILGKHLNF